MIELLLVLGFIILAPAFYLSWLLYRVWYELDRVDYYYDKEEDDF